MSAAPAYVVISARLILAAVFLIAAYSKVRKLSMLAETMVELGLPKRMANPASFAFVCLEGIVGSLFALGILPRIASVAAAGLIVAFMGASLLAMNARRIIRCSCFGDPDDVLGPRTLVRATLLGIPVLIYASQWRPTSSLLGLGPPLSDLIAINLAIVAVLGARWALEMPLLLSLRKQRRFDEVRLRSHVANEARAR